MQYEGALHVSRASGTLGKSATTTDGGQVHLPGFTASSH